jgi:hypothetical protein
MLVGSRVRIAHPATETESVATRTVFVEWLRAVRGVSLSDATELPAWRHGQPDAFAAALAGFAGLDPGRGYGGNLLHACRPRDALVQPVPQAIIPALRGDWAGLIALTADHLLVADTRPDDRLQWPGDPADPWPYGAWLVGAVVVLAVRLPV